MQKIVVASDSFKGSLSSSQVADAAEKGIRTVFPDCNVVKVNVADGGEGTVEAIVEALRGNIVTAKVSDPLGRLIEARYGIAGDTAIIEMASASGLPLLAPEERNPLLTSTRGTGEMIVDALQRGCRHILTGIGGSATNDAGTGMMEALGVRFLDAGGKVLRACGATLELIEGIDLNGLIPELKGCSFTVACDVDTPFCGPDGAAYVFAPQKGATTDMVRALDEGMFHFAGVLKRTFGGEDIVPMVGAGAAGGLGGGFKAFLGARLLKGIDMVLDAIAFDETIRGADLVITGEGKVDSQTACGKTAAGVLGRAKAQGIPVIALGGCVEHCPELDNMGFADIRAVSDPYAPIEWSMRPDVASAAVTRAVVNLLWKK